MWRKVEEKAISFEGSLGKVAWSLHSCSGGSLNRTTHLRSQQKEAAEGWLQL